MRRVALRCSERGQATVEAAVLIPVAFVLVLLLAQPSILLFDRMVMEGAAASGLRMLATRPADAPDKGYLELIESALAPIPETDIFHVGGAEWDVELSGNEASEEVSVTIRNKVRPLPLLGAPLHLAGLVGGDGLILLEVHVSGKPQPGWAAGHGGAEWTGLWD